MTVKQLIHELELIEDKTLEIKRVDRNYWDYFQVDIVKLRMYEGKQIVLLGDYLDD